MTICICRNLHQLEFKGWNWNHIDLKLKFFQK